MTPTQPTATTTEARVTEAAAILHKKFGVQCGMTELEMWIPIARAALSTAPSGEGVPGMVLVNVEPTEAMIDAFASVCPSSNIQDASRIWSAMLSSQRGTDE